MTTLHAIHEGAVADTSRPWVVLSHALGSDHTMWNEVVAILARTRRVLRYDHRGHGRSGGADAPFTIEDLADDAARLIEKHCDGGPVDFVGVSMGGMTAQALAQRHPGGVRSIVVANSASNYDDEAQAGWQTRIETVKSKGMGAIADGAMQRWLTPEFAAEPTRGAPRVRELRSVLEGTRPGPYIEACRAVAGIALDAGNARVACPTLVIGGTRDEATPLRLSERIAAAIPGARLVTIDAAHLSNVEKPDAFVALLTDFWSGIRG